jgi:hypothetical protein
MAAMASRPDSRATLAVSAGASSSRTLLERNEPDPPTDRIEPLEPIERIDPLDANERIDPVDAIDRN